MTGQVKDQAKAKAEDGAEDRAVQSRRGFLKGAGVAGVATAMSVLATDEAEAKEDGVEKGTSGYRESDHVKTYYETAKF